MNILVSNDDGIKAQGIYKLVEALSQIGDVYVAAPDTQKSATGHGITMSNSMIIKEVLFDNAKEAIQISGTPADCVKLGLEYYSAKGVEIDMVFAGINEGGNYGTDTLYSGTVSAAMEGALNGKSSVAMSVNSHTPVHFEYACELAIKTVKSAMLQMDSRTVLNINVPHLPFDEVKGIRCARLGKREYKGWYSPSLIEDGVLEVAYSGYPTDPETDDLSIDIIAMKNGYATITPLKYDLTNHYLIDEVEKWGI